MPTTTANEFVVRNIAKILVGFATTVTGVIVFSFTIVLPLIETSAATEERSMRNTTEFKTIDTKLDNIFQKVIDIEIQVGVIQGQN